MIFTYGILTYISNTESKYFPGLRSFGILSILFCYISTNRTHVSSGRVKSLRPIRRFPLRRIQGDTLLRLPETNLRDGTQGRYIDISDIIAVKFKIRRDTHVRPHFR